MVHNSDYCQMTTQRPSTIVDNVYAYFIEHALKRTLILATECLHTYHAHLIATIHSIVIVEVPPRSISNSNTRQLVVNISEFPGLCSPGTDQITVTPSSDIFLYCSPDSRKFMQIASDNAMEEHRVVSYTVSFVIDIVPLTSPFCLLIGRWRLSSLHDETDSYSQSSNTRFQVFS